MSPQVQTVSCLLLAIHLMGCEDSNARSRYTAGHADIALELAVVDGSATWDAFLSTADTLIDGERVSGGVSLEDIAIGSSARFTRPEADSGAFEPLCVDEGASVLWLPQALRDASVQEVPFLGISSTAEAGTLADEAIRIRLLEVKSPSGSGTYALWRDGYPPEFFMSSCDGIDVQDVLQVPFGHDHYNMAFSEAGNWTLTYEASAQLASGETTRVEFRVHYVLD